MFEKKQDNPLEDSQNTERKESLEYKKRIAELFKIGLNSDDIYAWHGTSIEAIMDLAKYGKLPATGTGGKKFFYTPNDVWVGKKRCQQDAEGYAKSLATEYYVLNRLPFEVKDRGAFNLIFDFDEELEKFIREEVIPHKVDEQLVRQLVREAYEKRNGVIVTLSRRIAQDYKEEGGDSGEESDQNIVTENGLPLQYITGIEPLGQYEREELEKIQKEVS